MAGSDATDKEPPEGGHSCPPHADRRATGMSHLRRIPGGWTFLSTTRKPPCDRNVAPPKSPGGWTFLSTTRRPPCDRNVAPPKSPGGWTFLSTTRNPPCDRNVAPPRQLSVHLRMPTPRPPIARQPRLPLDRRVRRDIKPSPEHLEIRRQLGRERAVAFASPPTAPHSGT